MTFARPDLLWLALAAVPVIILHLVRRRRKRATVSSLLLWEEVLAAAPRRFGPGVLQAVLSLLLILLALGSAVVAAAGPRLGASAPPPRPLLIAIGASARMQGERWEEAVRLAERELERRAPFDPVTVLLVSDRPRILAAATTDGDSALDSLRSAAPSLVVSGWSLAVPALTETLGRGGRAVAIGVRPEVPEGVSVLPVGGKNAGIAEFSVEARGEELRVLVRTAGAPADSAIRFLLGDRELGRASAETQMLLTLDRGDGGRLRAVLTAPSGPEFDDAAEAWIPAPVRLAVGVSEEAADDPFLRAALAVSGVARTAGEPFDVRIVAGRDPPDPLPRGDWILLGPPPLALGLSRLPPAEVSPIWEVAADHPVTRGVDAAEVEVMGAIPATLPPDVTPLLTVPGGAVAAAGEESGARYVWIGLDTANSTLPVTGAYPLLVRNALRWFASLRGEPMPPAVAIGEPIRPAVRLPQGTRAVALRGPGENDRRVQEVLDGTFAYLPESLTEGTVVTTIGANEYRTAVNAILPAETEAVPAESTGPTGPDRSRLRDTRRELRPWLALAAAGLLLLHWGLRRLVRS